MLKIGITGGIGSGKSLVSEMFKLLDIPVFNADDAAKYLMEHDTSLKEKIKQTLGKDIYKNDRLQRSFLAFIVFNDRKKLDLLNSIVHPATIEYGHQWMEKQNSPYVIKEAALFFETGSYREMDKIIGVYANRELRLERTMKRDKISETEVIARMENQMDEEEKMKKCDFIIDNNGKKSIIKQVTDLHQKLVKFTN